MSSQSRSVFNSTTKPLTAGQSFVGKPEDVNDFTHVYLFGATDQETQIELEYSQDGVTWSSQQIYVVSPNEDTVETDRIKGKYLRATITNISQSDQTYLRAFVSMQNQAVSDVLGKRKQPDPGLNLTMGVIPKYESVRMSGYYADVSNKVQDLTNTTLHAFPAQSRSRNTLSSEYTGHPTSDPELVEIASSSNNDKLSSAGMRTIKLWGLRTSTSSNYESEVLSLNGSTPVRSSNTWFRIQRMEGLTYGSNGRNVGNIVVRHTRTTKNVFSVVLANNGRSMESAYTIPANKTGILRNLNIKLGAKASNIISGTVSLNIKTTSQPGPGVPLDKYIVSNTNDFTLQGDIKIQGGTDILFQSEYMTNSNVRLSIHYELVLTNNP